MMNPKCLAVVALLLAVITVFVSCQNDYHSDVGGTAESTTASEGSSDVDSLIADSETNTETSGTFSGSEIETTEETPTSATEPSATEPETTKPETTKPETTKPETTKPETTKPETTKPPVTEPPTTEPPATEPEEPGSNLLAFLKDPYFKRGMSYSQLDIALPAGRFSYSLGSPSWLYTQEQSRYDISKGSYTSPEKGVHVFEDTSKYLYLDTNTGMFRMGIKGSEEYDHPRKGDERFTGALVTPTVVDKIFVKDFAALNVTLDFVLDEVTNCMSEEEFNYGLHTAQWNYYVFVQDSKSNTWFYVGLPLYDYRGTGHKEYAATDPGTGGTFIYIPSAEIAYNDARVEVGQRFTHTTDLLPLIEIAWEKGRANGFFEGCNFEDFYISGCNLGWEIPGTFDCMATVYEFSMSYALKSE